MAAVMVAQPASWAKLVLCVGLLAGRAGWASDQVERNGDRLRDWIPRAAFAATLFYEDGWDGSLQFAESYLVTHWITAGLKHAIHKRRPDGECCASFPSSHASTAFMGAGFIHARYGWEWALPAYAGATYVAISRVHAKRHYPEDVIAGAAIGVATSFFFTRRYQDVAVMPAAGDGYAGITVVVRW